MNILITGANGYIGIRLIAQFSTTDHHIIAVVRNSNRIDQQTKNLLGKRLTIIEKDFLDPAHTIACPVKVDVAYYLIHSMSTGSGYAEREASCAQSFTQWIQNSQCKQIVYLSGIIPPETKKLSAHLASRKRVAEILSTSKIPLTTLKASIIVGSGSASFEIVRDLIEKLPVMITPRWTTTLCQPIGIRNVIEYLTEVVHHPECLDQEFDIGGPDQLTYIQMPVSYTHLTLPTTPYV